MLVDLGLAVGGHDIADADHCDEGRDPLDPPSAARSSEEGQVARVDASRGGEWSLGGELRAVHGDGRDDENVVVGGGRRSWVQEVVVEGPRKSGVADAGRGGFGGWERSGEVDCEVEYAM